ncbi:MAG: type II toxin-antitoxin system YafQ family toxin [Bacteroidales bacterium]|jgi:mRNA interferase YafQ|nr:type II toxin-antitoxin system YafQ family toxin [Bacteroidales bacterium]
MKKIFPSGQYKKDFKRYRHQPKKIAKLERIIDLLANEKPIPSECHPHMLKGEYKGCMECHIEDDFLIIWFDEKNNVIELVRLGTHSELFKNN